MASFTNVEALLFDVFGTVVDWHGSVAKQLGQAHEHSEEVVKNTDWAAFAGDWRQGYYEATSVTAKTGTGSTNIDEVHRQILDSLLESPRWKYLAASLDDKKRHDMTLYWHKLNGWADTTQGLYALKKRFIVGTLSNGNARLLIDMAKYTDLPWDVVFSGDILNSYKPNPKMYLGAAERLDLSPGNVAMVAAHIYDLRAAASHGMKTIYVRRPEEDHEETRNTVKPTSEGGEVDIVVDSFLELANVFGLKVDV